MEKRKIIKAIIAILIMLTIVITITGCGKKKEEEKTTNKLVGTWVDEEETFTYEYKEDGTALMNGKEATYSIEGDTLTIKYNDSTKLYKYKYTLTDTSLTLENEDGNKYVYVKK